jgi:Protein of unknown function (DUF1552)
MKRITMNRRTVLRGMGGAVVALPTLECMLNSHGEALAQGGALPRRYAIVFAGQALGGDAWEHDRYMVGGVRKQGVGHFIAPTTTGTDYTLTTPLKPLEALKSDFNVITGMSIPFSATSAEPAAVPVGGAFRDFHGGGCSPLISGMRSTSASFRAEGITSDQVIANLAENKGMTPTPSLVLRAQPSWYLAGSSFSGRQYLSYSAAGKGIESQTNPQTAYNALFSNFTPKGGDAIAVQDFEKRTEQSVLSLIRDRREALLARVSAPDRIRLQEHFDRIRDLENRINAISIDSTASCNKPADPGSNWPVGSDNAGSGSAEIGTNTGYSDETKRAEAMADLIAMAFICDLTRVATLQITVFQSHMNVFPISTAMGTPIRADLHEVGHNGDEMNRGQLPVSLMLQWHIKTYARLVDTLKKSKEGAQSLLDSSAIVFMNEAGHGRQLNDAMSVNQTHSVENMQLLVAGRAGGMKPGRHIAAPGKHPAQALLGAMKGAGFKGDTLGEVPGPLPDLFA